MRSSTLLFCLVLPLAGCAATNDAGCTVTGFPFSASAADGSATPDHTLAPPGNQQQFYAAAGALTGPNCPTPANIARVHAQWTTSDPSNVSISSLDDATNGVATCKGATQASVTAAYTQGKFTEQSTASITCK